MIHKKIKKWLSLLGPGFITGASDDDPSGIATYSQAGAMFGYSQLWTALFTFPFMTVVQEMCGRIGLVTGKGIAEVIRRNYSRKLLIFTVGLLFSANVINIGADLGAMAAATQLIIPIPFELLLIFFTGLSLVLQIAVPYATYARYLKYLTFSLFAYIIVVFLVSQKWDDILTSTIIPSVTLSKEYLMNIVAILGTTISPYLFFWQASQEVEEEVRTHKLRSMDRGIPLVTKRSIKDMRIDTVIGMFFSNIVMFFIIATTASTLNTQGIYEITTAADAAQALRPLAGNITFLLFAVGIIGTGLLALPVLAGSAAYAVTEALNKRPGLSNSFWQAPVFYIIIVISLLGGYLINYSGIPPFRMLYYTAVLNGLCAPPLLFVILRIANNSKIMNGRINTRSTNIFGYAITTVMAIAGFFLIGDLVL